MQKIIPHLWFDKEAKDAAAFYTSVFPQSKVISTTLLRDTPSGDCDIVSFELWHQEFMAISAGPLFRFNPSVSFIVNFDPLLFGGAEDTAREALDRTWDMLSEDGKVLMPIDAYPFSKRYGWVEDRYGVSWQLMLTDPAGDPRPPIIPLLLFTGNKAGRAEEAMNFYQSVFQHSKPGVLRHYPAGMAPEKEGSVMFADFQLAGKWFAVMDSAREHGFDFNESISFLVACDSQKEIDDYWQLLSAFPEAEQCGWLKDKYGLSWQISSAEMETLMRKSNQEQVDRIVRAFLPMKKIDIAQIKAAAARH
ncbi:VOC family protein [Taibaiella koreensis]|uniref:VOC family protein n=1 Tax=Taibaiella koreensis TaxID=1268548 RepID=UPI000E59E75B|nr:VOC family protein [Taibaiella koreensis]